MYAVVRSVLKLLICFAWYKEVVHLLETSLRTSLAVEALDENANKVP